MAIPKMKAGHGWNNSQLSEPATIQLYNWSGTPFNFGILNDWADTRHNPEVSAQESVDHWDANYHEGIRSVFFWKPFVMNINGEYLNRGALGDSLYHLAKTYGRSDDKKWWYERYFAELKRLGVEPDQLVLDDEGSKVWGRNMDDLEADAQACIDDPEVFALMPEDLQQFDAAYMARNQNGRYRLGFWNGMLDTRAYRRMIVDTYQKVFGREPFIHNYGYMDASFPIRGWNARTQSSEYDKAIVNSVSSPVLYLLQDRLQNPQWYMDVERHPRWVRFLLAINKVRSCINRGEVVPWISNVGYTYLHDKIRNSDPWLDCEVVRHCILMGVTKFNYWNPGPPSQWADSWRKISDDALGRAIDEVKDRPKTRGPLEEWDWNLDYVETAGHRTTYEEFLERGYYQAPNSVYS